MQLKTNGSTQNKRRNNMKRLILGLILILGLSGCAVKNKAYKDLEKSPCACFEDIKKGVENV